MSRKIIPLLVLLCIVTCSVIANAQNCNPPAITANSQIYNIFSPEQEMILGDLNYQRMAGDSRFIQDEKLLAYVRDIGARLVRHLPPTGLKFQFFIIDIPTANAFNTPGGYVFLSRKLIAFTKTEDELAGVMAHELGHATVHHSAGDVSEMFKKILNVTQIADRKDITEKYNLLLERERTKSVSQKANHESEQQLEADRIGLFAMVAAGYDPNAFTEFFSRLVEEKAKSGNWFTNIFNSATPTEKRLREMVKATEQLPAPCRENRATNASEDYLKWQADVVSFREGQIAEELPGLLWKKELTPQLKSDISHFAISQDGAYFLAQDDFAITVVQREPLKVAFQIPTTDARPASFTPDGKFVVFGTEGLRFEKWNIADAKPVEIRELVVRHDCWEHEFSPDGKFLACVDFNLGLNVLDTQSGKRVWEKKDFAELNVFEVFAWIATEIRDDEHAHLNRFFHLRFSPDSHYLVATRSNKFRFRFTIDMITADKTEDTLLALDLSTLKPMSTGGELKKATRRPFIFIAPDKILGTMPNTVEGAGVFSFPQGKRLAKFNLAADELKPTGNPNYVVVKPLANAMMGLFDISMGMVVNGMNKADATIWNDTIFYELASGKVTVATVKYDPVEKFLKTTAVGTVDIPVGSMRRLYAANVSDDLKWLSVSSKTRGAIWDLSSGERKMHVRGFRGTIIAPNGAAISDFPRYAPVNHSLVYMNAPTNEANALREIPEKGARQYGRFVLIRKSLKAPREKDPKEKEGEKAAVEIPGVTSDENSLNREVLFELHDVVNDKLVWSKEFKKEAPDFFFDDYSGRMIFYWSLGSDAGKARLKEEAALAERARQLGNKDDDYLVEVYDAFAAKSVGVLLLETGKGSFDIESGFSEGNWLVLRDDNNRVLIYAIKEGELRHRFFGAHAAMNPSRQQVIVENYPGELTLYDLATGNTQARLRFKTGAAFVRFSLDGKKLLVLTSGQVAYAFDTDRLSTAKGD
ncbi:MAG TPA: M48 family metalloprotease [Pyrinomonadaceae bacterium]|nr:M48 family metalloprotease [Pyrinomonadaceae bacterium]